MKKTISILLLLMLSATALVFAGGQSESVVESGPEFVMQVGHAQSTISPRHLSLENFKKAVENKTGGKVKVEIFPAGQLGNETEMTEAVSLGTLQAVRGGELEYLPEITMLSLPFLAKDIDDIHKLCYSDFVTDMLSKVESEHGMKVLAVGDDSGFRQITNNEHPIKTPADMKGLKMRTVLEIIDLSMKGFGATTVSIPFTDLYMSLKTGVADGQENPISLIYGQKFYEVQKYATIWDYMFFAEVMYVNLDWFNSLPSEYQAILQESAEEMMTENSEIVAAEEDKYLEIIKDNGTEVYVMTDEDKEAFKPLAENVWKKYIELGRMTREDLDVMLDILGQSVDW